MLLFCIIHTNRQKPQRGSRRQVSPSTHTRPSSRLQAKWRLCSASVGRTKSRRATMRNLRVTDLDSRSCSSKSIARPTSAMFSLWEIHRTGPRSKLCSPCPARAAKQTNLRSNSRSAIKQEIRTLTSPSTRRTLLRSAPGSY